MGYKAEGKQTSPENAGAQNMTPEALKNKKTEGWSEGQKFDEFRKRAFSNLIAGGNKSKWSDEALALSVDEFFRYCVDMELKPTPPLLQLWLAISRDQLHQWKTNSRQYGRKSDIIKMAYNLMEAILQQRIEKYPTGNIFLLKTTHGHVETSKLDVTSDGQALQDPNEVKQLVDRLNLLDTEIVEEDEEDEK